MMAAHHTGVLWKAVERAGRCIQFDDIQHNLIFPECRTSTVYSIICKCMSFYTNPERFVSHRGLVLAFSSKAHFKAALNHPRAPSDTAAGSSCEVTTRTEARVSASWMEYVVGTCIRKRKVFRCPREGCMKFYKQRNGLQYHLAHVRVEDMCCQTHAD
jgi:hypothetical protein